MYFKSVFFHITHFSSTTYFLLQNQAFFSHNLQNWYSGILNSLREGLVQSQQSDLLNKITLSCFSRLSTWPLTGVLTYLNSLLIDPLSRVVKQTWACLCHCIALWFLCWLWTASNQADFLTQQNRLVSKYVYEVSGAILSRPLCCHRIAQWFPRLFWICF